MTTLTKQPTGASSAGRSGTHEAGKTSRRAAAALGDLKVALFFIAPAMIGFVLFYLVPTIRGHLPQLHGVQHPGRPGMDRARENYERDRQGSAVLERHWASPGQYVVLNIALQTVVGPGPGHS